MVAYGKINTMLSPLHARPSTAAVAIPALLGESAFCFGAPVDTIAITPTTECGFHMQIVYITCLPASRHIGEGFRAHTK